MIVLRHCQSEFNLHFTRTREDPGIPDPVLTGLGQTQAADAARALAGVPITRILVSPYRRALQTASPIAQARGLVPQVSVLVRERFAFSCDIGSPPALLQQGWPHLDFAHLDDTWWPAAIEPHQAVIARAAAFRATMAALPDHQTTLVVSHWGFLLALTGNSLQNGDFQHVDPAHTPAEPLVWRH